MKKKELKNRIEKLELEVLRLSIEKAIWVTMPQNLTKERHDYYESLKNDLNCSDFTPSQVEEAERRIFAKIAKTEGPESESELKENECPYKIGDKWIAKNGEIMTMAEYDPTLGPDVHCVFTVGKEGRVGYSVKGIACCELSDWDLVSKVKEGTTIEQLEAQRRQDYDHPF